MYRLETVRLIGQANIIIAFQAGQLLMMVIQVILGTHTLWLSILALKKLMLMIDGKTTKTEMQLALSIDQNIAQEENQNLNIFICSENAIISQNIAVTIVEET